MTPQQIAEAQRLADRLDSSDPEFDDCSDAATLLRALAAQAAQAQQPVAGSLAARAGAIAAESRELAAKLAAQQPPRERLTDAQISRLVLQTVYEGDTSTPYRDAWAAEIGIPFARAIEAAHGIAAAPAAKESGNV